MLKLKKAQKKKTNEDKLKEIAELKKAIAEQKAEEPEEVVEEEESEEEEESSEVPEIDPPEKTSEEKERILVVKELPMQPVRSYVEKDGTIINMITVEEALTKLFESESSEK